ncbi:MAG TPA: kelch repeat-containing protein [Anaerolineaceae bacterium]|nr:kelch repeat-containing protein [Anaerolineaceae bacterium]
MSSFCYAKINKELYGTAYEWNQIATNPVSAMDNVLAAYDGLVWSITGYGSTGVSTYDPATQTWATIASSAPPFSNYARSGCQIGSKVYIYGDAAGGYTGLWSYDMAANTWLQETPTGTAPTETGIWAPSWVADAANGLCYMTGGATAPGGGNLSKVYVYDAVNNQWLAPLPDFTSIRDFHAAFLFTRPADGHPLLCVAGGANVSGAFLDSTQCYDFTAATWEAENATLGATPFAWWGMGYTQRSVDSGELWMVAGADGAGALTNQTWYYDVADAVWYDYGPLESGPVYRTAAVTLDNMVYHVGGSVGSFSPSGLSDVHMLECPECTDPVLEFTPDQFAQVMKTDSLFTQWASVCNPGAVPLDYAFDDAGTPWLTQEPLSGTVAPGECAFPAITFDTTGVGAGNFAATLSVSSNDPFAPLLNLPVNLTVLDSADLVINPDFIEASALMGDTDTKVLNIANAGNLPMHWRLLEYNQPFKGTEAEGQGEWLYRATEGVLMDSNTGPQLAYPSAYRWTPANPPKGGGMSVLVYGDDPYHPAPSTLVDQALRYLGVPYTAFYDGNFSGFMDALENGGPWDMVLVANDNYTGNETILTALDNYVTGGGNLIINCWWMSSYPAHPLWTTLGVTWVADDYSPADPVYWWLPDHPNFNYFDPVPELTSLGGEYGIFGQHVEPLAGFTALAGYVVPSAANEAALVVRDSDGGTIFKGFLDGQNSADLDADAMLDGAELWANMIRGIPDWTYPDIPWLTTSLEGGAVNSGESVNVDLLFNSTGLMPGTHTAALVLFNTAIGDTPEIIPLYFTVVAEPEFTKIAPAEVLPGEQFTYTLTIDPLGFNAMLMEDPLPAEVAYVPGSLTVTPDVGAYGYDSGTHTITWSYAMPKSTLNNWQPAVVHGPTNGVPPQTHSTASTPLAAPQPAVDSKAVLWDQPLSTVSQAAYVNQEFTDYPTSSSFLADDFVADSAWAVETIFVPGDGWNGFTTLANATALNFLIYADAGGVPAGDPSGAGAPPMWALSLPPTDPQVTISNGSGGMPSDVTLNLSLPAILPPGNYWLIFYPTMSFSSGGQYGRQPADTVNGAGGQFINPGGGFGYGTDWQSWTVVGATLADIAFRLEGIVLTPLTISFDVTAEAEDVLITNTAYLDVAGFDYEASADTLILPSPIKYIFLPVILK